MTHDPDEPAHADDGEHAGTNGGDAHSALGAGSNMCNLFGSLGGGVCHVDGRLLSGDADHRAAES